MMDCAQIADDWLIACPALVDSLRCARNCDKHDWPRIAEEWSRNLKELCLEGAWPFEAVKALSAALRHPESRIRKLSVQFAFRTFFEDEIQPGFHSRISRADLLGPAISDSNLEFVRLKFAVYIMDLGSENLQKMVEFSSYPLLCPTLAVLRVQEARGNALVRHLRNRVRENLAPLHRLELDSMVPKTGFLREWPQFGIEQLLFQSQCVPFLAPRRFDNIAVRAVFKRCDRAFERNPTWDFWASRSLVKGTFGPNLSRKAESLLPFWTMTGKIQTTCRAVLETEPTHLKLRLTHPGDWKSVLRAARDGNFAKLRVLKLCTRGNSGTETTRADVGFGDGLAELAALAPGLVSFKCVGFQSSEVVAFLSDSPGLERVDITSQELSKDLARTLAGLRALKTLHLRWSSTHVHPQPNVDDAFFKLLSGSTSLKHLLLTNSGYLEFRPQESFAIGRAEYPKLELLVLSQHIALQIADNRTPASLAVLVRLPMGRTKLIATLGRPRNTLEFGSILKLSSTARLANRSSGIGTLFEVCSRAFDREELNPGGQLEEAIGQELVQIVREARWSPKERQNRVV
jgi:hypothetical protein